MQKKMYLILTFIVILSVVLTSYLSNSLMQKTYIDGVEEKLTGYAYLVDSFLLAEKSMGMKLDKKGLKDMSVSIDARITLIQSDGVVAFDTEQEASLMENHSDREEIRSALNNKIGVSQRYSTTVKHDMFYLAIPSQHLGDVSVIRLSVPLKKIQDFNRQTIYNILIAALIGILITYLIGYRLMESILRPIHILKQTAKRITDGEYSEKVQINFGDEMGELAKAFNLMTEELNVKIKESDEQNSKMNAILSNMLSVVIAVDREKRVMFMNKEAEELFEVLEADAKGRHILEVFRNSNVLGQIQDLFQTNEPSKTEIEVTDIEPRIFHVYANPIHDYSKVRQSMGVVMIFQDITEIRRLENMRKDFVANVSHELKTPLTSIKGFVETLKNGAMDNPTVRDRFLDIIEVEAMRLTHLINDLLVLSDIEKKASTGEKEPVHINRIAEEVLMMLTESARKKQIEIISQFEDQVPVLYGNPNWIKQMLINLIDNGIKYTPNEGIVKVRTTVEVGHIVISIEDTGMGIAKEHIDRLFERFYRVDKARSRNIGGTGLGLAIVKHIIIAYHGDIKVLSEVDKGTTFIVKIPIHSNSYKDITANSNWL